MIKRLSNTFNTLQSHLFKYVLAIVFIDSIVLIGARRLAEIFFKLILFQAKVPGITNENIFTVISNPVTVLLLLLFLVIVGSFALLQVFLFVELARIPYRTERLTIRDFRTTLMKIKSPQIFGFVLYIFIIMPNLNLGIASNLTANIHIPKFVLDTVFEYPWLALLYFGGLVFLFYINLRLYFMPILFITNPTLSFLDACRESIKKTKQHLIDILNLNLMITALTFLLSLIIGGLGILTFLFLNKLVPTSRIPETLIFSLMVLGFSLITAFAQVFTVQSSVDYYYEIEGILRTPVTTEETTKRFNIIIPIAYCVLIAVRIVFTTQTPFWNQQTLIVSHRGESVLAVENSIEGLKMASEQQPDYVEMDVQLSSDKQVVVFHDKSMKRIANDRRNIQDVPIAELVTIQTQTNHNTSTISSFETYLKTAKELNQSLMVELKPYHPDYKTLVDETLRIIKQNDMEKHVVFQSLSKETLLYLKEVEPKSIGGYILGLNIGGLENLPIDFYSIEDSSITRYVLKDIRRMNKQLFVWTLNDPQRLEYYLSMNVTGVITDELQEALTLRETLSQATPLERMFQKVLTLDL